VMGNMRWQVVADFASARVVSLDVAGLRVLVAGDLDAADEAALVSQVSPLNADVLVVPHRGATQDTEFLCAVHPRLAIISVGRGNSQHDPSVSALKTLSAVVRAPGRIVRTDQHGDISITVTLRGTQVVARRGR
jgi:competence protein ComEC